VPGRRCGRQEGYAPALDAACYARCSPAGICGMRGCALQPAHATTPLLTHHSLLSPTADVATGGAF